MHERQKASEENIVGSLLLAHPALRDPNFRRTVVLMSSHNDEGAMGVVLNRPLEKTMADLDPVFALGDLATVPVYRGGPVQTEQVILVAWETHEDGFRLHFGIEPEKASELRTQAGAQIRAFLGFAGWTAGQLENEMKQSTWIVAPAPADLMSLAQDTELWRSILSEVGDDWKLLANEPEDTSRN